MGKLPGKVMGQAITGDLVRESVSDTLRRKMQWTRCAKDMLANTYGWGSRKSESIYYGEQAPTAADLLNLMASDDDVFEKVIELTGRRDALSADKRRAIMDILEGK